MFRRFVFVVVLALAALAVAASAQQSAAKPAHQPAAAKGPQTARQALIEMLTTKSDTAFERHLPDALLTRLDAMKTKDAKTGKTSSPVKGANTAFFASKDARFFESGPTFLVYTTPKTGQKIEVSMDRDEPTATGNEMELGFHIIQAGKESVSAFTPKFLVRMKQETGSWRLAELGFSARLQLDDGAKLDELMNNVMSGVATMQQQKQPSPPPAKD